MGIEDFLNQDFSKKEKQRKGMLSKRQGDNFEEYFKSLLVSIQNCSNSQIVAFRKHSNEVVGILAKKKNFGLIKKLGHLKGDLDFSITVKNYSPYSYEQTIGHTVFAECKSGGAVLNNAQKWLINLYISNLVPFFIFCEKPMKKYRDYCIVATHDFAIDKENIRKFLAKGDY